VFFFVLLMIVREGMETALLLSTLFLQQGDRDLLVGGLLGVAGAALLAWAWIRYGRSINLGRFFQVTAIFLLVFTLQLVIYTMHEFFEAGVVPLLDNEFWHVATEPYGPEGVYGEWLTYLMVLIPAGWLAFVWFKDRNTQLSAAH
jgi:high-affinity iron transporter